MMIEEGPRRKYSDKPTVIILDVLTRVEFGESELVLADVKSRNGRAYVHRPVSSPGAAVGTTGATARRARLPTS